MTLEEAGLYVAWLGLETRLVEKRVYVPWYLALVWISHPQSHPKARRGGRIRGKNGSFLLWPW